MSQRPNIVMIVVHDIGRMLGCHGHDPLLRTPRLDEFAAEGVRFNNHFACAAFCSPSRGALASGQYPHVNGLMGLTNLGWDMPPGSATVAETLGQAGYETALIGFQHEAKDVSRLGFETVSDRGLPVSSEVVAPLAAEWLQQREATAPPFYLQIGFSDVHRAYPDAPEGYANLSDVRPLPFLADTPGHREDLRDLYAYLEHMDGNVGVILDALERSGLRDNTCVVFTTDHGIPFPRAKGTLYDPGIGVTMLMRWPQGFAGGQTVDALTSHVDVLPSFWEAAGAEPLAATQGSSLLPLLRHEPYEARDFIFAELNTSPWYVSRCVRTLSHKFIRNFTEGRLPHFATDIEASKTRRDMPSPVYWDIAPEELYDLDADPLEQTNLAGDPVAAPLSEALTARLEQQQRITNDPILSGPIARPPDEEEMIARAFANSLSRRPWTPLNEQ